MLAGCAAESGPRPSPLPPQAADAAHAPAVTVALQESAAETEAQTTAEAVPPADSSGI